MQYCTFTVIIIAHFFLVPRKGTAVLWLAQIDRTELPGTYEYLGGNFLNFYVKMVRTGNGGGLAARGVIFTQSELVVSGQGGNSNSWDDRAEREDSRTKYNLFETQRY